MSKYTTISVKTGDSDDPIISGDERGNLRRLSQLFDKLASGSKTTTSTVTVHANCTPASGTLTVTSCNNADTFTIAGTVFTAQQAYATGTVTLTAIAADATVTVDGVVFTAKASPSGIAQFDQSGDNDADAASLVAKINAHPSLTTRVTATAASNVVTIRAYSPGTAGNDITLASSTEAVSGATLANGAAVANNKFCFTGSATEIGDDIVRAFNASTTTLLGDLLTVANAAGVVTFTAKIAGKEGNLIDLAESTTGARLAVSAAVLENGAGTTHNIEL